jgi:hypothetical protein
MKPGFLKLAERPPVAPSRPLTAFDAETVRAGECPIATPARVGLYPIVTFQYSSTTLYHISYHIQYLFF